MKIRIVTDSGADLTAEMIKAHEIEVINLPVNFKGEENLTTDADEFWKKLLNGGVAQSSQPSPEDYRDVFESAKANGEGVVCITLSSGISGTNGSANRIKNEVGYEHIYVIDGKRAVATGAEALLVLEACKLRDEGMEAKEIAEKIEELKGKVRLYACIDSLKYLARGGRIPSAVAVFGNLLNIKPLVSFSEEGKVDVIGKTIGTLPAMKKLIEIIKKDDIDENYPIIPLYSYTMDNLKKFLGKLESQIAKVNEELTLGLGATIGTHIGPYGFGLVYVVK